MKDRISGSRRMKKKTMNNTITRHTIERYQIIKLYLIQYTGIEEKQAEHDASLLETIVSHEAVEKISALVAVTGVVFSA
jgi:Mn-dependent DtxR family transcriptional regulator